MLITFSRDLSAQFPGPGDWRYRAIEFSAQFAKATADVKWARQDGAGVNRVRFTLPGASFKAHDDMIATLLAIDPDAKVETARSIYEGLDDFVAQKNARVPP